MRFPSIVAVLAGAAACSGHSQTPAVTVSEHAPAIVDGGGDAAVDSSGDTSDASDAALGVLSPPLDAHWRTAPPAKADLYIALDGDCREISLHLLDNAVFLQDGMMVEAGPGYVTTRTIARFTDAGIESVGLIKGALAVEEIGGHFPDAVFATTWRGGRTNPSGRLYQLEPAAESSWKMVLPDETKDAVHSYGMPVPWRGGFLVEEELMPFGGPEPGPDGPTTLSRLIGLGLPADAGFTTITTPVPKTDADSARIEWRALRSGELVAAIETTDRAVLTTYPAGSTTPLHQTVSLGPRSSLKIVGETTADLRLLSPTMYRLESGGWVVDTKDPPPSLAVPGPNDPVQMGGVPGDSWRIEKRAISRDTGAGWKPISLPPPPFSASTSADKKPIVQQAFFAKDGELFVIATYKEKGTGWRREREREIVYRSHRPAETLRCNEADPEAPVEDVGEGVQSWPPMATAECQTPFALLTRTSRVQKKDDHKKLLEILTKHKELGPLTVVELRSGDRTFAGVPAASFEAGQMILRAVAKSLPIRGELLCADPTPLRTFPINP